MHGSSHTVKRLPVHLPQQQRVYFHENHAEQAAAQAAEKDTQLTAWLKINQHCEEARRLTYPEMHKLFTWNGQTWKPRKRGSDRIVK